jgi:hypothetical protein
MNVKDQNPKTDVGFPAERGFLSRKYKTPTFGRGFSPKHLGI